MADWLKSLSQSFSPDALLWTGLFTLLMAFLGGFFDDQRQS